MQSALAIALVLALGVGSVGWATAGFRTLTSEGARRIAVAQRPLEIPNARVVLTSGEETTLHALLSDAGRTTIVTFIYTRCTGLCAVMGNEVRRLQSLIEEAGDAERVALLTLSFDPAHDSREILSEYATNIGARAGIWRIASIPDALELAQVLDTFGIVAIPDGAGGFEHNAAFHLAQADGRLVEIIDQEKPRTALRRALAWSAR